VQLFTPLMQRWVKLFSIPENDTDDFLQELFTLLVVQIPKFQYDPEKSFRGWLYTISRRLAVAWAQRKRWAKGDFSSTVSVISEDPREAIDEQEYTRYLVQRGLAIIQRDFPETSWKIFQAVAIEGKSGAEVAQEFQTTPNAVYLIRSRVLARLRAELDGFRS